jgi:prostamide/prostaglandin F2alpha synthase
VPLGASKQRQETHPPDNANELADLVLQDARGADVRLGDLWAERPVVLVWLRHYG